MNSSANSQRANVMNKVNTVYQTKDYSLFSSMDGNRRINELNLKRLIRSINDELLQVPIIVNEKYQVIDGQHRLEACKKLEMPIYFIVVSGYDLDHVHKLNAIGKRWSMTDYIDGYCSTGNESYLLAKQFLKKYPFSVNVSLSLLLNKTYNAGSKIHEIIKSGSLKLNVKEYERACEKANQIMRVAPYYDGYKRKTFVLAMIKLLSNPNFDLETFIQKLKYQSMKMVDCTKSSNYLKLIEEIYNFKSRGENTRFY